MGCCETKNNLEGQFKEKFVFESIRRNNLKALHKVTLTREFKEKKAFLIQNLDQEKVVFSGLNLNALSYSLILGESDIFVYLHKLGCSISYMEKNFIDQGINPINILCIKGYSSLLLYYLPIYISGLGSSLHLESYKLINSTIEEEFNPFPNQKYTPIHFAAIFEHIQIITVIQEYFKSYSEIPKVFDLEYQDEDTGMNCPLLAVKYGNFAMVKFLHFNLRCDFNIKNAYGLNAIQIALYEMKFRPQKPYMAIICYLIDIVGINIDNMIDELINDSEDPALQGYFILKLKKQSELRSGRESEKSLFQYITIPENTTESIYSCRSEESGKSVVSTKEIIS
ncbi:hypothetical protein SteCoe_26132 [Stentor coeruleus]|uniref:Uncharacterized protein n=1 Tax=Stentor coeruleus TaxID=5963 RepID=A0A1R2BDH4_9CILI|nr:hypothetical protein SteCoe_26132 [Stentor coeruleus]